MSQLFCFLRGVWGVKYLSFTCSLKGTFYSIKVVVKSHQRILFA